VVPRIPAGRTCTREEGRLITRCFMLSRTAAEVAGAAVAGADPLSENAYKIDLVRGIVEESLLALAG
jgi:hypothetical protein